MGARIHSLEAAYRWLDEHINYERRLESVAYTERAFQVGEFARRLEHLGSPQRGLRTVHLAGTRGKGSAALLLEGLMRQCGLRTAVFTSPHLREYRERIRIDGEPIRPSDFTELMSRIAEVSESLGTRERSFRTVFENLTALFFLAARRHGVDWAIIETGLGGRLDSTNIIEPGPVLLTRISLEHTHLLGETVEAIATEKAAILKRGGWAVVGSQDASGGAREVFERRAAQEGTALTMAEAVCPLYGIWCHREGMVVQIGWAGRRLDLAVALFGSFQAENIQNALAMYRRLVDECMVPELTDAQIGRAVAGVTLDGRMERVCRRPEVFADGGHCPAAARAVAKTMEEHFGGEPAVLVLGMMREKQHEGFMRELARWPGWHAVGCYRAPTQRAADPARLARMADRFWRRVTIYTDLQELLQSELIGAEKSTRVVATGSFYSVAQLQEWGRRR